MLLFAAHHAGLHLLVARIQNIVIVAYHHHSRACIATSRPAKYNDERVPRRIGRDEHASIIPN